MQYFLVFFLTLTFFSFQTGFSNTSLEAPISSSVEDDSIHLNNRILVTILGKPISLLDVVKKLDLQFYRNYPTELKTSNVIKYQYYRSHWRNMLETMIDHELILQDAQDRKIEANVSEIHEELETQFGPNVIYTLDELGISFDEAKKHAHDALIVNRMMLFMVRSKAMMEIKPELVQRTYDNYIKNNSFENFVYQVISIRDKNGSDSESVAYKIQKFIEESSHTLEEVIAFSNHLDLGDSSATIHTSDPMQRNKKNIAQDHYQILQTLTPGMFSKPISQISRADKSTVWRIFFLQEHTEDKPQFEVLQKKIYEELMQKAVDRELCTYLASLRSKYGIDEQALTSKIPENYQPFSLKNESKL